MMVDDSRIVLLETRHQLFTNHNSTRLEQGHNNLLGVFGFLFGYLVSDSFDF